MPTLSWSFGEEVETVKRTRPVGDAIPNLTAACLLHHISRSTGILREGVNFGYEGIPQHIILNVIGSVSMILLFSCIRKKAWNYGRIAFVQQVGVSDGSHSNKDVLFGGVTSEAPPHSLARSRNPQQVQRSPLEVVIDDSGMFSWILTTLRLTDAQIEAKSGPDAVYYLSFQRHLIFIGCVIMVVSIVIVLPINAQGNPASNLTEFQSLTIRNLGERGKLLWVHVSLTIVYLIVTVAVLRHFSKSLAFAERDPVMSRTVMISRIAKRNSQCDKLERHFLEIYPDVEIEEISFAYNISRLRNAELSKNAASSARLYWENYCERKGKRPRMRPYTCGKLLCCCSICGLKSSDAIEYYHKEEERYGRFVELERKRALARPLGIAFITYRSVDMAHRVVTEYRLTAKCLKQRPTSSFSRKLKSSHWIVNYAPLPEDIYWENLALSYKAWYFKAILVNVVLILLVIVYSTPVFILNGINKKLAIKENFVQLGMFAAVGLTDTVPTMLLWITAVSLPSLVSVSDRAVGFWTKTAENRSRMVKTFTFLLFMVIILPSLGSQSFIAYFTGTDLNLNCIFYTGNSIFFVNYVITSSFLGTTSELMRLPELFCYAIKLCFAKSSAEMDSIRKSVLWDFQFGAQYAWTMLNFTMFIVFSLICPIITPFGLLYTVMKHYVDRYNVYFAYAPCKVEKEVHVTAINFVVVTMFLLQIIMLAYVNTKQDDSNKLLQVFSILGFCITTSFFIGQVFFNMCTNFSPISYQKMDTVDKGKDDEAGTTGEPSEITPLESNVPVTASTAEPVAPPVCRGSRKIYLDNEQMGRYYPKILRSNGQSIAPTPVAPSQLLSSHVGKETSRNESSNSKKQPRIMVTDVQLASTSGVRPTDV
ncbi:unnamed protein product [Allacma fusca]|uniref:CSC1-like protein 2 n=1 Tax=Allacma fusca TaxID=39272 RepID=A0A8J2LB76_9HEXA|nr:unnamed protein product [Allacma fusca]